jgi:hemolysin activation/secretion protein
MTNTHTYITAAHGTRRGIGLGSMVLVSVLCLICGSESQAQTTVANDWIQFPVKVSPRTPIAQPTDSKAEIVQFPPPKAISMGVKSGSTYRGSTQTYVVTFGDGTSTTVTEKAVSQVEKWASNHIIKTTTYKFPDGSEHSEQQRVDGVRRAPTYKGNVQTVITEYGDGTTSSEVSRATDERRAWTDDHSARIDTYTFTDGNIHQDIVAVSLLKKTSTYTSGVQEVKYTYTDGSVETKKYKAVSSAVTWSQDHITRHTKYQFQDGSAHKESEKFEPVAQPAYFKGEKKVVAFKYANGYVKEQSFLPVGKRVTWSSDKLVQFTTYKYADGDEQTEEQRFDAVLVKTEYDDETQIKTMKLGDGSHQEIRSKAVSVREEWERDHVTKLTNYVFQDGKVNTVKTLINPIRSVVSYDRNLQYITVRYGDGVVDSEVNKSVSDSVRWKDDHITKVTTYKFKDGSTSSAIDTVLPTRLPATYEQDSQIIITKYADGHSEREVNKPISQQVDWSSEKTQKNITYVFADGAKHVDQQFVGIEGVLVSKEIASKAKVKGSNAFILRGVKFEGNTKFDSEQLEASIKSWIGSEVDLTSLKNAANLISGMYREEAHLAKVEIPQQEVNEGIVTFVVSEAKLATVALRNQSIDSSVSKHAENVVKANNDVGNFVDLKKLDKTALLLSDIPGVQADLTLKSGVNTNETDVLIDIEDGKKFDASISADNSGARSTGRERVLASVSLNGLVQRGEQVGVQAMRSQGSDYVRMAYSEPVGPYGWRAGVSAAEMKYRVISSDLVALNAHGPASVRGLELVGPILKNRSGGLSLQFTADAKQFHNETFAGVHSKYSAKVYGLNLFGNQWDTLGGSGLSTYSLAWTSGNFDLSGSPNQLDDATGVQTAGSFNKYKFIFKREQELWKAATLSVAYQSQWASKNLDASEKIFLGGAQGVRAYGANEAGGSIGQILNLELQQQTQVGESVFTYAAFYDVGHITVNKFNDYSSALPLNSYTLKGYGLWAGWNQRNSLGITSARLTWARRIGVNPSANLLGLDQDGSLIRNRWWLSVSQSF